MQEKLDGNIIRIIKSKIRYKIMFFLFILISISAFFTMYITAKQIEKSNIVSTTKYLGMLNESIFQSLRNAMNTGDPIQIAKSAQDAREISGIKKLNVAKSKDLIELYAPESSYTKDIDVLEAFNTKKEKVIEYSNSSHDLRMIKPMIAVDECMMCHANQKVGDVIGVMDLTFSLEESDSQLLDIIVKVFIISTILGWITLIIVFLLLKTTTQPIEKLQNAIRCLRENKDSNNTIEISSSDEIGKVAEDFNSYIQDINKVLEEDKILIKEAKIVIDRVKNGWYSQTITATTSNEILEEFKQSVNGMIRATKKHFTNMNQVLQQYAKYDYTSELKIDKIEKNGVFEALIFNINMLKNSITEMLIHNKSNGVTLRSSSDSLLNNVTILNNNSNEAAAAIEQTAAAIEQITSNIANNNSNIVQMSELASNVTSSARNGEKLANETSLAMAKIDEEVYAINDAIAVIDQITFQTNILSLNAAVEAATAGEVGKGFAVVAQEVRNLAHRSAQAANDIKDLVANATQRTENGKNIAQNMKNGYTELNENIIQTIELIESIETASKEQLSGIEQINSAVNNLDRQTQENASVASDTNNIASDTNMIAQLIVEDVNSKKFIEKTD